MAETTAPAPTPTTPAPVAPAAPTAPAAPAAPAAQQAAPTSGTDKPAAPTASGTIVDGKKPDGKQDDGRTQTFMLFGLVGVMILMFWWMSRSQRKREQQRQEMLKKLKVGDRVMTASGIIGEVVELADDEATLRIDPRKDGRMRIKRGVIVGPAGEAATEQAVKEQQQQR